MTMSNSIETTAPRSTEVGTVPPEAWTMFADVFLKDGHTVELLTCDDCETPIGIINVPGSPLPPASWLELRQFIEIQGDVVSFLRCDCCDEPMGLMCADASLEDGDVRHDH
ncbi:MAG: hypothetical protein ACLP4V_34310 [Methylocella sp.]